MLATSSVSRRSASPLVVSGSSGNHSAVLVTLAAVLVTLAALLAFAPLRAADPTERIQKRSYEFTEAANETMRYSLFVPSSYDASRKWPLVVALHGLHSNPEQIIRYPGLVSLAEKHGFIVVAPMGYNTKGWYGSLGARSARFKPENLGELSEKDVLNVLDLTRKELQVDPDRIYLLGHSMGGGGAWHLGLKHPDIWAALAPIAPAIYRSPDALETIRDMPVILVQGDKDKLCPVETARKWAEKMKALDMDHSYIEVAGGGHVLPAFQKLPEIFAFFEKRSREGRVAFESLFDGESLDGWRVEPQKHSGDWTVRDGVLRAEGSKGASYLVWKDESLRDFELELGYRLLTKGNTGVEIRGRVDRSGKRLFEAYHADLGHVGIGDEVLGAWDMHFAKRTEYPIPRGTRVEIDEDGKATRTKIPEAIQVEEIHDGDWNHLRVVVRGHEMSLYLNGKISSQLVDRFEGEQLDEGFIALQLHEKGTKIEFRDVRLRKLASTAASQRPSVRDASSAADAAGSR